MLILQNFPPNVHVHIYILPVIILSVDSDWLISIKIGQSLTGNRNYFYLCQSRSNFDQVSQKWSLHYQSLQIKVRQSDLVKLWPS